MKDEQLFENHSTIYLKPENRVEELLLSPPEQQCAGKIENMSTKYNIDSRR